MVKSSVLLPQQKSFGCGLPFVFLAAFIASAQSSSSVAFPPKVLEADLIAITNYYSKGDKTLPTYIHWPGSISFKVQLIKEEFFKFVKVDGVFQDKKLLKPDHFYNGLYYRDEQFYVKMSKAGPMEKISMDKMINYVQPDLKEIKPYLSIRYFGPKELAQEACSFYSKNKEYIDLVVNGEPSKFLITLPNSDGHFLDYSFWTENRKPLVTDGIVKVLIKKKSSNGVVISDNVLRDKPIFDQRKCKFIVPFEGTGKTKNVFGIRVTANEFLAEVRNSGVKMLNSGDIFGSEPFPERRSIVADNAFLRKLKAVEPKFAYRSLASFWPKSVRFQVHGVFLVKRVNSINGNGFNKECPFIVEFEEKGKEFSFEDRTVEKLCTDDTKLWVE